MGRPTSEEAICNLSLDYLKQSPLNSITTPITQSEQIFSRWYDIERQAALRAHPWKFAIKRARLNPDPITPPLFGYLFAYDLPNDYIRKISIGNDYCGDLQQKIEIENGQILAAGGSESSPTPQTLYLRYVYDMKVVAQMDPLFIEVFALGMAIDLSPKFSVAATSVDRLMKIFEEKQTEARAANGQDSPPKRIQVSKLLARRRGYQYGIYAGTKTIFGD